MWLGRQFPEYSTLDGTAAMPHQPPFSTATFRPLPTAREVDAELGESSEGQKKVLWLWTDSENTPTHGDIK